MLLGPQSSMRQGANKPPTSTHNPPARGNRDPDGTDECIRRLPEGAACAFVYFLRSPAPPHHCVREFVLFCFIKPCAVAEHLKWTIHILSIRCNLSFLVTAILIITGMASYSGRGGPSIGSVYVCNLPPGTDESMLAEFFGTIGLLKKDKRTGRPKIWLYRDKATNEPKGDATVTYEDPHAAFAAVEWFDNKDFHGSIIGVHIAESKGKDSLDSSYGILSAETPVASEIDHDAVGLNGTGKGSGRGDTTGKTWQQDGDWLCPNTSCGNVNFAFRGVCNRCGTARPAGVGGSGGSGGRGRGRGNSDMGVHGRSVGAPAAGGLFGPNDWPCPMCGNINWAKRTKCNICNTNKPGHHEGGVRGGRGGGYKELDEEELEETKRRRREAEEDDGEMYDEFGNLKKKFRAKAQQSEVGIVAGFGRAGWEVELGMVERDSRDRSDRGRDRSNRESSKSQERDGHAYERDRHRSRSRERDRDREKNRPRERDRIRERDHDYERGRERGRDRDSYRDW